MSLIHWWPLNGDTKNYGTSGEQGTESNVTYTSGKIGQSMYTGKLNFTAEQWKNTIGNTISIAMWIYTREDGTYSAGTPFFGNGGMTKPNNRKFTMFHYPVKTTLHCSWQNDDLDSTDKPNTYLSITYANFFEVGKWIHLCVVQDAKTETVTVYRNGTQYSKINVPGLATMNFKSAAAAPIRNNIDYQQTNDIRIYNHALSQAEVKELSKALVVHYTFDDILAEPTTNLITSPHNIKYVSDALDNNINAAGLINAATTTSGTYTLSGEYNIAASDSATSPRITMLAMYEGESNWSSLGRAEVIRDGTWRAFTLTGTTDPSKTVAYCGAWIFDYSSPGTARSCYARNLQFELKDHATPYTPNSRGSMLYNEAGYGGNGTLYNSILSTDTASGTLSCHTPRINPENTNGSVTTDNSAFVYTDVFGYNYTPTEFTVAWWWKVMDWGNGIGPFGLVISNGNYMDSTLGVHDGAVYVNFAGGGTRISRGFTGGGTGKWTHFALTFKPGSYTSYINGVNQGTATTDTSLTLDPWRYVYLGAGCAGGVLRDGDIYWGDFRYYNTCLTDNDIAELYKTKAYITDKGDIMCGEFIEDKNSIQITDKYTIEADEIIDNYKFLKYVEFTEDTYIDTGIAPGTALSFDLTTSDPSDQAYILTQNNYGLRAPAYFINFVSGRRFKVKDFTVAAGVKYSIQGSNDFLTVNGISGVEENDNDNPSGNAMIFSRGSGKLYSCKLRDNGVLVRDFIPALRVDGIVGLYDTINKQFYTSPTGTLLTENTLSNDLARFYGDQKICGREIIEI